MSPLPLSFKNKLFKTAVYISFRYMYMYAIIINMHFFLVSIVLKQPIHT